MAPSKPIALNPATIVHRLLTNARGWEVQDLCDELEIADRTYRKYRQLLQEEFLPLIRRGKGLVQEVHWALMHLMGMREIPQDVVKK